MISRRTHLRNIAVSALIMVLVLLFATQQWSPAVVAQGTVSFDQVNKPVSGNAGSSVTVPFTLTNNTGTDRTFSIATSNLPANFSAVINPTSVLIANTTSANITVLINIPGDAPPGVYNPIQLIATASNDSSFRAQAQITLTVNGSTRTPTASNTGVPSSTPTISQTPTAGPVCRDSYEDDNSAGNAKEIQVNRPQPEDASRPDRGHAICPSGDEDWLYFGGLAGKVYTIDVPTMATGLDLSLTLYNEAGNQLAFNDDYYNRAAPTPDARAPGGNAPNDIKPRIQSWTAPDNGRYYIRVRDAAGGGGGRDTSPDGTRNDRFYSIVLQSESYGPTPTQIAELCQDLFEPDGLPEEARLTGPNEIQPLHTLCPTGDADWIRFFGAQGKTYFIFTNTDPYRSTNPRNPSQPINKETEAGADTIIYLTDRDGVSLLDFNDDIPGGNTLDSQIEFTPSVDGFYFVQVKNRGDIGNQFIRYDLTLQLCLPGQTDCGRTQVTPEPPTLPPDVASTEATEFSLDTTPTTTATGATPTEEASGNPGAAAAAAQSEAQAAGFADMAFQRVWQRNDQPVAGRRVNRTWTWGPKGNTARSEDFRQSPRGLRMVQYFDKGRMEINDPGGDRAGPGFVTSGLLVQEMITGRAQVGAGEFTNTAPAQVVMAGDADDPNAPTYASLSALVGQRVLDLTGEEARSSLARDGSVKPYTGLPLIEALMARYVQETGHNIPAVFWTYLNARGIVFENGRYVERTLLNWADTLGYPISEPYWVRVRSGGSEHDVLIQAFERRVLTYSPDNPVDWQVEQGNVGQHYYIWRYGQPLR